MSKPWVQHYGNIPTEVDTTANGSVLEIIEQASERFGGRMAYTNAGAELSFAETERFSRDVAAWLQNKLGVKKGDRVALMTPNVLAYAPISFGVIRAGAVQVNVNPLYSPRELKHQLNDADVDVIVIFNQSTPTLAEIIEETGIKTVITLGLDDVKPRGLPSIPVDPRLAAVATPLSQVLQEGRGMPYSRPDVTQDDLIFLQYTGGTTGLSKGAQLTHGNLVSNIETLIVWFNGMVEEGEETIITALPLYHIFALMVNLLSFYRLGASNVLVTNPRDMDSFVGDWAKQPVTIFTGVNTLYVGLLNHPGFAEIDHSALKLAFGGGAPVQKAVSDRWRGVTGIHIIEGYGLSETGPVLTMNLMTSEDATASIGLPFPSTDIVILDDDENEVPQGETGELCAKGPQIMPGYWRNDEANAKTFTKDGYFKTGDIAVMDETGYFRIVDRKKDMILVSGFNVFPNEIEDVLAGMDGLVESACVGVSDEKTGEAIKVYCVKKDEALSVDDVIAHCRKNLTAYKVPKQIAFIDELPKSAVGKILRRELRD